MRTSRRSKLLLAALVLLGGCQAPASFSPLGSPGTPAVETLHSQTQAATWSLAGVLDFAGRNVQATAGDVMHGATLQLIDPGRHMTVVTGQTSTTGAATASFSLDLPATYVPQAGQILLLEAVKGLGNQAPGHEAVRLRTFVQWTDAGWTSITGASVALTPLTTAVSLVSGLDPSRVPPGATLGTVTYDGTSTFVGPLPGHPASEVLALADAVKQYLAGEVDPVAATSRLTPTIDRISTTVGRSGDLVALHGDGFSPLAGVATVSFGAVPATTYWLRSVHDLYVLVPPGATSSLVTVWTAAATSNAVPFTVLGQQEPAHPPVLSAISRSVAHRMESVTLTGEGFDPVFANNLVKVNGVSATLTSGNATSLTFMVPTSATSGAVSVTNSRGTSASFYLGVITISPRSIVEAFTDTATMDATATTLTWASGKVSSSAPLSWTEAGSGPAPLPGADASFGQTNPDGSWLNTFTGAFPKGGGVGQAHANDVDYNYPQALRETKYDWPSIGASQGLATNGKIVWACGGGSPSQAATAYLDNSPEDFEALVGGNNGVSFYQGFPFQDPGTGFLQGTLAGLTDSDVFYYIQGGQTSFNALQTLKMSGHSYIKTSAVPLPPALGTIQRLPGTTYGYRLASNGAHLFLWGLGTAPPYNTSSQGYLFELGVSPDGYSLYLVRVVPWQTNNSNPVDSQNYSIMGVDDRHCWANINPSYYYNQIMRLADGAYLGYGFSDYCANGNTYSTYVQKIYDGRNDCYYTVNPNQATQGARLTNATNIYSTTQDACSVVSPAITLPAGQTWSTFRMRWVCPMWTEGRIEILNASDSTVIWGTPVDQTRWSASTPGSEPIRTFDQSLSLTSIAAIEGVSQIKLKAYLNSRWSYVTPYLQSWSVTSAPLKEPLAQSLGYDTGAPAPVSYLSYSVEQPAGAPRVGIEFADSSDNAGWSAWTTDLKRLRARYVRWRIKPLDQSPSPGALVKKVRIDYEY